MEPIAADAPTAEDADPHCLDPGAAARLLAAAPWRRLAVIGDSIAAGVREPLAGYRDASFADRTARALGDGRAGFEYANLARHDARIREIHAEQLPAALAFRPDLVLVTAGGNDALGATFDAGALRDALRRLLAPLRGAGALPVTIGLFDLARSGLVPGDGAAFLAERLDALDAVTREVAAELDALHVDTHHHPLAADPAIFASDLIHANARGHAVAAAAIAEALAGRAGTPV